VELIVERPAALDVHKAQVTACVRVPDEHGRREEHVAEFQTTVRGLLGLRDWLAAHRVEQVVMEATGVYWKAPWAILEDDFECLLVNARHVKQVPGRKTDVSDAAWLCRLAEAGLLKASFVPPKPIRQLRNLTRYRKTQIQERAREVNRLHKALEDAGIKLDCVAADVMGKSGRDMLDALVAGTTDPEVLADLARRQMRKKIPALREALEGHFDAHHALWVGAILAHIDFLDEQIDRLSDAIEEQLRPFAPAVELCCAASSASRRAARNASWPRSASTCRALPPRGIWRPGPANVPATTSRPANAARARPATAPNGWTSRSKKPPWPRSASRPTTPPRNTSGSSRAAATNARSARSSTH
jgi:transposase